MVKHINIFRILCGTTNVNNANSTHKNLLHYIYAAGGQLVWQRHSWLSVAFPGIFISTPSKDNHIMPVSKQEQKLYDTLRPVLKTSSLQSFRPDFLKNEATGNNYEIDIYLPELKIGIEYQGAIHFTNLDSYKNDSDKSRLNDTRKDELLEGPLRKVAIVEVFETDLTGDIISNVAQRIKNTLAAAYKKRQFGKCRNLQRLLNNITSHYNPSDIEGKRRLKYYEMLYTAQACGQRRERFIKYKEVENYVRDFPYVADLSYTGEKVELPIIEGVQLAVKNSGSNRLRDARLSVKLQPTLNLNGVDFLVEPDRTVSVKLPSGEGFRLTVEDWQNLKAYIKSHHRILNEPNQAA